MNTSDLAKRIVENGIIIKDRAILKSPGEKEVIYQKQSNGVWVKARNQTESIRQFKRAIHNITTQNRDVESLVTYQGRLQQMIDASLRKPISVKDRPYIRQAS